MIDAALIVGKQRRRLGDYMGGTKVVELESVTCGVLVSTKYIKPKASPQQEHRMPKVHLIEGPVGAGKSTYAAALAFQTQGVHIALDEWFAVLFSPDRPVGDFVPSWYIERKQRLLGLVWSHSRRILASGADAILELGLIQRLPRSDFCRRVQAEGFDLVVHVLEAPYEVRRTRVQRRNTEKGETFAMVVPDRMFEMASRLWEAPDEVECSEYPVEFVSRGPDGGVNGNL